MTTAPLSSDARAIEELRSKLGGRLTIVGHHYEQEATIQHCDIRGDSLELARRVPGIASDYIVFCGVYFMAESAALLAREGQHLLLPDHSADCVMAQMTPARLLDRVLGRLTASGRKLVPLAYVNTSLAVKAVVGRYGGALAAVRTDDLGAVPLRALLARYHRSDFAVLLPHRTLKEADSIAGLLLKAMDALPPTRILDRDDMMHIGICSFRSGQSAAQVMEHAEAATRNAVLQGSNSWSVYDDTLPEKGRGNVRWRTLIEQMLSRGGPRLYQKPAVTRDGRVHHRELMSRMYDGKEEVIAAEYMPMVLQFGLAEEYDRLQVTRLLPFLGFWPEENLALQLSVESLIRPRFQRWLRDALMQCEKSQRQRIIFELAEADVCQYIGRLQPVMRLVNALGVRVAVVQAGLTLVGTSWIKQLDAELIKLHPGLARNIEKRSENQLLVQSLVEACKGMPMQVFATGVRSRSEWLVLSQCGVTGGQGEFFAASQPLDTNVKKYSQRYSV